LAEVIDQIQPARQIDSHFDAVTLHQFDALIESFAEHWLWIFL
jgi:hypothetical protein